MVFSVTAAMIKPWPETKREGLKGEKQPAIIVLY